MTEDDVIAEAFADGFTLEERVASHTNTGPGVGFAVRMTAGRASLKRRQAIAYMADRLHRITVFQ